VSSCTARAISSSSRAARPARARDRAKPPRALDGVRDRRGHRDTTLVYSDEKLSALHAASALDENPCPQVHRLPEARLPHRRQRAGQHTIEGNVETFELRGEGHVGVPDDEHALMGCSPGGAVLYKEYGDPSYRRCAQGKCEAALTGAQKHHVPVAVTASGIVGVEARGAVLAVRKGGPTDFYAVPNGLVPLVAMTDGNALDVLAWTADGLVIARASAR
jgi:hypothetical protein